MSLKYVDIENQQRTWAKTLEKDTPFRKPDEFFLSIASKYIRRNGKILDGGCGLGYLVVYLSSLGYDAVGVDFSRAMIRIAKVFKNTALHVGDITCLPYKENAFDTCISEECS